MLRVAQGGTVRLPAVYRDASGALVDPSNPRLEVMDPTGDAVASGLIPTRESIGEYHYDWVPSPTASLGTWVGRFAGEINGLTVVGDEAFEVVLPGDVSSQPTGSLLTLSEYKGLLGIQAADTRKDAQVTALLPSATRAIRAFTGRNFEVATGVATPRTFQYEGEWIVDIDDCEEVTGVSTDAGVPNQTYDLTSDQWTAMPQDDSDVFYYLLLHGGPFFGVSPEMGFERNLDQYEFLGKRPLLTVTAVWGWPAIPEDVKLATAITVNAFVSTAQGGDRAGPLSAEAIEGFSRSWARGSEGTAAMMIPNRARDLLSGYQRIFV